VTVLNFHVYASTVGGSDFCTAFPLFPDCPGWRNESITDSYFHWFCDYVDIPGFCENKPDPNKAIEITNQDYCCRYIGSEPLTLSTNQIFLSEQAIPFGKNSPPDSIAPLIIWTNKDHYNFRDKVIVYGKFDFTNLTLLKNIQKHDFDQTGRIINQTSIQAGNIISKLPVSRIDIELNGVKVLRNIPVNENGWFSSYFYLDNSYLFSTQNNLLEVNYIMTSGVIPSGGPRTHAIYQFTTGDIAKKEDNFELWIDDSSLPNNIHYGVNTENPERFIEIAKSGLVTARLTTSDGYTIPLKSSFQDLSHEYDGFKDYGQGMFEIQVTYGDNVSKKTFEYLGSN
jgi:hypothetical protein